MDAIYTTLGIPFGYVLRFIFEAVDNYGLALILFTLFARLLMIPTSIYQTKGTVKTQRLQPKIRRINAKYKGDQKKIQEETQALYQREGHNPMNMGCLPLAIQFIIIFGLIGVIYHPLKWALAIDDTTINSLTEIAKGLAEYNAKTGKQTIELIDEIQEKTDTTVVIIEHRLEDVLWRDVDRIVLMGDGKILADLHPDELLSTRLLEENGIREPLYLTALRYAGVELAPAKKPAHVDSVVIDKADRKKMTDWFWSRPAAEAEKEHEPLLEVRNLTFGYERGRQTLRDVSLTIQKGEMVSIVGKNGAGKSTFSKLVCGFETPDSGEILFQGRNLLQENIRHRAKHIGYVMQNPNQMISKTMIFDEAALSLRNMGKSEEEIREKVEETLKVCGLFPFRNWPVSALSFGQKKRVTIASVLVQDPELIILDEPTAGQDFRHYTEIMEFLRGLNEKGVTVDMHLMLEYTPRALVFADGRLIADRSAAAALCDPQLIRQAALKETSLFTLANQLGISPAEEFVQRFIEEDREVRSHGR